MTTSSLTSGMTTLIRPDLDLGALPALPRDDEGPVFNAPWEAQAFAITLSLHAAGMFTWREWADALAAQAVCGGRARRTRRRQSLLRALACRARTASGK